MKFLFSIAKFYLTEYFPFIKKCAADCPKCGGRNRLVEVIGSETASYTEGFWCLACNARWTVRGGAKHLKRIKVDWKDFYSVNKRFLFFFLFKF